MTTTAAEHRKMMIAVRIARARVDWRAASKAPQPPPRSVSPPASHCESLQRADRANSSGRIGRGIGERVLRGARAAPYHPAERTAEYDHRDAAITKKDSRGLVTTS